MDRALNRTTSSIWGYSFFKLIAIGIDDVQFALDAGCRFDIGSQPIDPIPLRNEIVIAILEPHILEDQEKGAHSRRLFR